MPLEPTGTCFSDALELMAKAIADGVDPHEIFVIHAIVDPLGRLPYSHAWLEVGDQAFCYVIHEGERAGLVVSREVFRKRICVRSEWRYSVEDAYDKNRMFGNFGPWERSLFELCSDYEPRASIFSCFTCMERKFVHPCRKCDDLQCRNGKGLCCSCVYAEES